EVFELALPLSHFLQAGQRGVVGGVPANQQRDLALELPVPGRAQNTLAQLASLEGDLEIELARRTAAACVLAANLLGLAPDAFHQRETGEIVLLEVGTRVRKVMQLVEVGTGD